MKIVYIGENDCLSLRILERLKKEENEIFFLSEKADMKKGFSKYHHYSLPESSEEAKRIFSAIRPDTVIFEGNGYLDATWGEEQKNNFLLLETVLEECCCYDDLTFILLSSTEVYGEGRIRSTEDMEVRPVAAKGKWLSQEELMTEFYHITQNLKRIILRVSEVFSDEIVVGAKDVFGQMAGKIASQEECEFAEQIMQPIHASDVADAVVRVLEQGKEAVYNVCSSDRMTKSTIAEGFAQCMHSKVKIHVSEKSEQDTYIVNDRLKHEQEWVEFWPIREMLQKEQISFVAPGKKTKERKKEKSTFKKNLRQVIENIVIFIVFLGLFLLTRDHSLFSCVDWLLIYVVVVSLAYGVRQSTIAVVLASVCYFFSQGKSILEMTNFYSHAENILMILEFLFFGIVIGYSMDVLREENRIQRQQMKKIRDSYEKLKDIDDKNILLKNEYERRVLDAKTSLPRLYSIIQRITVLDINRIFMEILHVVGELLHTDTVAVYRISPQSSFLRLVVSMNPESVIDGKSWNLERYPEIEDAIRDHRLYEGDIWKNEPAVVFPVGSSKGSEAVIVIKKLSLEDQSLYSMNLLRTLLLLISDSIDKALQYDRMTHDRKYIGDTEILKPEEFQKEISLAKEKKQNEMAESCMIQLFTTENMSQTYHQSEKLFREMDVWGSDEEGNVYVLLQNTSDKDAQIVLERLRKNGIIAKKKSIK